MTRPNRSSRSGRSCNMNVGFFGIQYSFGLQQSNMSPIYRYLGRRRGEPALLWLAGPDDRPARAADHRRDERPHAERRGGGARRTSSSAPCCAAWRCCSCPSARRSGWRPGCCGSSTPANNVTMEPYRAFVSDRLDPSQHSIGFLTQSAFTGLGQTLSYLTPSLLVSLGMSRTRRTPAASRYVTVGAFLIGAVFSITSILVDRAHDAGAAARRPRSGRGSRRCRAASAPTLARDRRGDARHAGDDEAARGDEAVPVVRDVLLLAVHRALARRPRCSARATPASRASARRACSTARSAASTTSSPSSPRSRWCRSRAASAPRWCTRSA